MAQTPQEFFEKNMRWFALVFLILFLFKSAQSCNRNMSYNVKDKGVKHLVDSLEKKIDILEGEKKQLAFELKLQSEKAGEAQKRAEAIQSVAEKIKSNTTTTVNVRGNVERDTIKNK